MTNAVKSKENSRGASVEEAKNLWEISKTMDEKTNANTTQPLDELLDDLEKQDLITPNEKNTIKETGKVTIGNKTIIFKKMVELESYISKEDGKVYIIVNFKENNYDIYARNILGGKSEDEMMDMFIESVIYYHYDYYEERYPGREIDKELVLEDFGKDSLLEIAHDDGFETIKDFLICRKCVKPEEFEKIEKVEGEITDPDGNVVQVDQDTNLEYQIFQDSTYTFLGKTSNGNTAKLDVTVNLENEYRLEGEGWSFYLMRAYDKIDILEEYLPKMKVEGSEDEIDLIPAVSEGEINLRWIIDQFPSWSGYATIYLTIDGSEVEQKVHYSGPEE